MKRFLVLISRHRVRRLLRLEELAEGQPSAAPERPTTATVELRDINFAVNAAGEIAPAEQVSVRPEINGLVEVLPVDVGDRVKKDALLFKLDDKLTAAAARLESHGHREGEAEPGEGRARLQAGAAIAGRQAHLAGALRRHQDRLSTWPRTPSNAPRRTWP